MFSPAYTVLKCNHLHGNKRPTRLHCSLTACSRRYSSLVIQGLILTSLEIVQFLFSPRLADFSEGKPTSEEFSEGMLWMEDRGMSVSVLVSQVDSVSLVQLSIYLGSNASVLEPPQPMVS